MDELMQKSTEKTGFSLTTSTALVCLNFKVPLRVRQEFKIYAARHNITMTELLLMLVNSHLHHIGIDLHTKQEKKEISIFLDSAFIGDSDSSVNVRNLLCAGPFRIAVVKGPFSEIAEKLRC